MNETLSIDILCGELSRASAWRKKELTNLMSNQGLSFKAVPIGSDGKTGAVEYRYVFQLLQDSDEKDSAGVPREKVGESTFDTKIRVFYPFLYAHWEGFVKEALKTYLKWLGYVNIDDRTIHPNLFRQVQLKKLDRTAEVIGSIRRDIENQRQFLDYSSKISELTCLIEEFCQQRWKLDGNLLDEIVDTGANLRLDKFKKLVKKLDLKCSVSDSNVREADSQLINELVDIRNGIAHGDPGGRFKFPPSEDKIALPKTISIVLSTFEKLTSSIDEKALEVEEFRAS